MDSRKNGLRLRCSDAIGGKSQRGDEYYQGDVAIRDQAYYFTSAESISASPQSRMLLGRSLTREVQNRLSLGLNSDRAEPAMSLGTVEYKCESPTFAHLTYPSVHFSSNTFARHGVCISVAT